MPTVRHPMFSDNQRDVPAADLQDWLDQGWLSDAVVPDPAPVADVTPPRPGPRR